MRPRWGLVILLLYVMVHGNCTQIDGRHQWMNQLNQQKKNWKQNKINYIKLISSRLLQQVKNVGVFAERSDFKFPMREK